MTTILARITELERAITEIARAHPHAPHLAAMEYAITDIANAASTPHLRKLFEGDVPPPPAPRVVYVDRHVEVEKPVIVERVVEVEKIVERIVYAPAATRRQRPAIYGQTPGMVSEHVRTHPGATAVTTARALGIAHEHVSATYKMLRDRGKVRAEGKHPIRYYWIGDDGLTT